uniref:Uncharacterized protein n=1 Tax=Physcomitrium patens TaxID=3218 RepID=A0A2K1IN30_PHYPA|nr:hypothetical protein PHYPA_026999 [Physcomitrium patens]
MKYYRGESGARLRLSKFRRGQGDGVVSTFGLTVWVANSRQLQALVPPPLQQNTTSTPGNVFPCELRLRSENKFLLLWNPSFEPFFTKN